MDQKLYTHLMLLQVSATVYACLPSTRKDERLAVRIAMELDKELTKQVKES